MRQVGKSMMHMFKKYVKIIKGTMNTLQNLFYFIIPISLQPDDVKVFRAGNFRMVDIRINA